MEIGRFLMKKQAIPVLTFDLKKVRDPGLMEALENIHIFFKNYNGLF
jgi:hypothetical protein